MLLALGMVIGAPIGALVMSWCTAAATADQERERMQATARANQGVRAARVEANVPSSGDEHEVHLGIG